jgi:hypothetical protein
MGVFRSDDDGKTWVIKVDGLPYVNVSVLKKSGDRLLLGTRSGLFYSDDQAESWAGCEGVFPLEIAAIESSLDGPPRLYAADSLVGYIFVSDLFLRRPPDTCTPELWPREWSGSYFQAPRRMQLS